MTMETALTAEHVKLLRKAIKDTDYANDYSVVFDWRSDRGYVVTLCKTARMPEGADPSYVDYRWELPADGRIERYRGMDKVHDDTTRRYVSSSRLYHSEGFDGVKAILRQAVVGDVLMIKFVIGNDTDNLRNAGLSHDYCYLAHTRKGNVLAVALVADCIAPPGRYSPLMEDSTYMPQAEYTLND